MKFISIIYIILIYLLVVSIIYIALIYLLGIVNVLKII